MTLKNIGVYKGKIVKISEFKRVKIKKYRNLQGQNRKNIGIYNRKFGNLSELPYLCAQ